MPFVRMNVHGGPHPGIWGAHSGLCQHCWLATRMCGLGLGLGLKVVWSLTWCSLCAVLEYVPSTITD